MKIQVEVRELAHLEEFQGCVDIQREVWGFDDPFDIVPLPLLIVSKRNDGIVMGAFRKDETGKEQMIGFVYALPGIHGGKKVQWSHMLAVIPGLRDSDIGYQLKIAQYKMAQKLGYEMLEWTYDPLESRNANFNLRKLGCIVQEYEENIYGYTSSPLHQGSPTDRFVAHWPIPPLAKQVPEITKAPEAPQLITSTHRDDKGVLWIDGFDPDAKSEWIYVEIPSDMQSLKTISPESGLAWRFKTREIFQHYFGQGYVAYSFVFWTQTQPARSFYLLRK